VLPYWRARLVRGWLAVCAAILAALSAFNLVQLARRTPRAPHVAPRVPSDIAMRLEKRFGPLRTVLQEHHVTGTIGYFGDLAGEQLRNDPVAIKEYFVTQFVLVPVVLEADSETCTWAVTNFHRTDPAALQRAGFRVVVDLGDGVRLLRKEAP
jgi:hypothetical protein